MPRNSRIVLAKCPHHVVQRGNRRQVVFFNDEDRKFYLSLLSKYTKKHDVDILAYCLMDNHVHLILEPKSEVGLASVMRPLHMRYAQRVNVRMKWSGHLWQCRFFSSVLSNKYFWTAVRYIENNPVAARIVDEASNYLWSSAYARCRNVKDPILSYDLSWAKKFEHISNWAEWLRDKDAPDKIDELRESIKRDYPVGSKDFIAEMEQKYGRNFTIRRVGRPKKRK